MARKLRTQRDLTPEGTGRPGAGRQDERAYQEQARQRLIEALEASDDEEVVALGAEVEREQHKAQQGRPARTVDDIARRWARAAKAARQGQDAARVRRFKAAAEAAEQALH
jgi:hypothetical protein